MAKYKQLGTAKRNCGKKIVEKKLRYVHTDRAAKPAR